MAEEKLPDADEIKIVGIFASTRTTPDGPSLVYADINDIIDFVEYNRRTQPSTGNSDRDMKKGIYLTQMKYIKVLLHFQLV